MGKGKEHTRVEGVGEAVKVEGGVSSTRMGLLRKRDLRELAGISHRRVLLEEEHSRWGDQQSQGPKMETDLG